MPYLGTKAFVDNTNDAEVDDLVEGLASGTARLTNQQLPLLRIVVFGQRKTLFKGVACH